MAELDIAGTGRHAFVTLTVFDDEGWAAEEDMWWSGHGEDLAELLASLTGMSLSLASVKGPPSCHDLGTTSVGW